MHRIRTGTRRGTRGARALRRGLRGLGGALALASFALAMAAPARALRLEISDGGLSAPTGNFGCDSGVADCNAERDFVLQGSAGASGHIELLGDQLHFEISVLQVSFEDPGALAGEPSQVSFSGVSYSGSATALVQGDLETGLSIVVPVVGSASVVGSFQSGDAARGEIGGPTPFAVQAELLNVNCLLLGGSGQCGLQVGEDGFTLALDGADHDFVHTFNLTLVPEPSTASLLLSAGLAGVLLRRRARRR